mmetsp:Transcript_23010/g.54375  ORF Transcript_23010/g.54375 Transcript_23010/m.54375 type:complete len:273 (-) Transcript_23010:105-923(-)
MPLLEVIETASLFSSFCCFATAGIWLWEAPLVPLFPWPAFPPPINSASKAASSSLATPSIRQLSRRLSYEGAGGGGISSKSSYKGGGGSSFPTSTTLGFGAVAAWCESSCSAASSLDSAASRSFECTSACFARSISPACLQRTATFFQKRGRVLENGGSSSSSSLPPPVSLSLLESSASSFFACFRQSLANSMSLSCLAASARFFKSSIVIFRAFPSISWSSSSDMLRVAMIVFACRVRRTTASVRAYLLSGVVCVFRVGTNDRIFVPGQLQ